MRGILTYHSVDPSGSPISIAPEDFERHAAWLASGAVRVVPLAELLALPDDADACALTFDDGFESFAAEAWPRLRDRGLPATMFVVTGRVGTDNAWGGVDEPGIPRLPLMDWDALGRLAEEGLELGAHGRTHPHLDQLDDAAQADEIAGSADDLERRTGARPTTFCYPYGDLDARAVALARAHFARACTTELRALSAADDACRLPRLDAYYYRAPGTLEAWGSPAFRARLWARRAARDLRRRLRV